MFPPVLLRPLIHVTPVSIIAFFLSVLPLLNPAKAGSVSFDPSDGILLVDVVVNGHIEARFGLDSGADDLYIDSSFAAANDIFPSSGSRPFSVTGIGTKVIARSVTLRSISVADEGLYNLSGAIVDLAGISQLPHGEQPDGLIGFPALNDFVLTVDYASHKVSLDQSWPDDLTADPIEIEFTQMNHWISLREEATESWFLLDLCASHSLITQDAVAELQLQFSGDKVQVADLTLAEGWNLGPLSMWLMPTATLSALRPNVKVGGLLGQNALDGLRISIDYDRRIIRIERP